MLTLGSPTCDLRESAHVESFQLLCGTHQKHSGEKIALDATRDSAPYNCIACLSVDFSSRGLHDYVRVGVQSPL